MSDRYRPYLGLPRRLGAAAAGMLVLLGLASTAAEAQPAPYLKGAPPWYENSKGISGLWNIQGYKMSNYFTARDRLAKTSEGKPPPLLPGPAALLEQRLDDADLRNKPFVNSASLCLPQGMPCMLFAAVGGPLQILETPGQVTFISDAYNEFFMVYLDVPHSPKDDLEPTYHGESVGHWEGDTLVIDTIGLNDKTTLDQVGTPHSAELHTITRVRRIDPDTLEFAVTFDDPKTFSAQWERKMLYHKAAKDERVSEVVCENQRNLGQTFHLEDANSAPPKAPAAVARKRR